MPRICSLLLVVFCGHSAHPSEPSPSQMKQWIIQLDDPKFQVRELASSKLNSAGNRALPIIQQALENATPETSNRLMMLLQQLSKSKDSETSLSALSIVQNLASGKGPNAGKARDIVQQRKQELIRVMKEAGVDFYIRGESVLLARFDAVKKEELTRLLKLLTEFQEVESLSFEHAAFGDEEAKLLSFFPNLEWLNLYQSSIGDETLKIVGKLKKIKGLPIGRTKITDAGLKHLVDLKELDYLGLRGTAITDSAIPDIKRHQKLLGLNLSETKISDRGISQLKSVGSIEELFLNRCPQVTDKSIEHLSQMKGLKNVWLLKSGVSFEGKLKLKESKSEIRIVDSEKDYPDGND